MRENEEKEIILKGIGVSPGVCIGKAYLVDTEGVNIIKKYYIGESDLEHEKNRFKQAVKKAKCELRKIIDETPEDLRQDINILETHLLLLKDKMLYERAIEIIEQERLNAEWSLKKVVSHLKSKFKTMSDPYLRERITDILQVSDLILRNLIGLEQVNIKNIHKRVILVASDISPVEATQIQLERIMGLVTDFGGVTSHTGIIARTLGLPALMGVDSATRIIKNDDLIIVDGNQGILIANPDEQTLLEYTEKKERYEQHRAIIARESKKPAVSLDQIRIHVLGNIDLPEEIVSVLDNGGDGVGLYRTEFQYLGRQNYPREEELFEKYKDVIEVINPRPVTIRTLDINGDKALNRFPEMYEKNPDLGLRAIRYCLKKKNVFNTQLRAILKAGAFGENVRIMFPMISCLEEVIEAKSMFAEAAKSLEKENVPYNPNIQVGIMVEIPSVAVAADIFAPEIDFFSIGTNDLIQFTLAIDRTNKYVTHLYRPLHPAVLRMLKFIGQTARDNDVKVFMCGEMASDPLNIPILLGLGIDELSMNPQSIPIVKKVIQYISIEESRDFVTHILKLKTADEITKEVEKTYGPIISDLVYSSNNHYIQ